MHGIAAVGMPLGELEAVCEKSCGDSCKNTTFAPDADEELESLIAAPKRAVKSCHRTAEASDSGNTRAKRKKAVNNTGTRANHPGLRDENALIQPVIDTGDGKVTAGRLTGTVHNNNHPLNPAAAANTVLDVTYEEMNLRILAMAAAHIEVFGPINPQLLYQ